jgi:hypothetical protein
LRNSGFCVATPTEQVLQWHFAQHDATQNHHRRSAKPEFLGSQQGGNRHVPPGFHAAVDPQSNP